MKLIYTLLLLASSASASFEIVEKPNSISAELDGKKLWTYNHDVAEGKPYIHPLASSDGHVFTDLRPEDHPWHRGVWFSWKYINGVNYWEESRETGKSAGETRIIDIKRSVADDKSVRLNLQVDYAPAGSDNLVLKENRSITLLPPEEDGTYRMLWSATFIAQDQDVELNRTPLPHEEGEKPYGGYAGLSVRMNGEMTKGAYLSSEGLKENEGHHQAAHWHLFNSPDNGSILFMDHPKNLNAPSKWYMAPGMGYFSPAVIHDGPYTIKAGESLTLTYSLVVFAGKATAEMAQKEWNAWTNKKRIVILTGANNHNWGKTTPAIEQILEESGKFKVDVVTEPEKLTADFLKNYDVLLSNWNGFGKNKPAPWSEELKAAYVEFVRNGSGHVVVHAGSSSYYDWEDYQKICLATWESGTGHKKPHEFDVRISDIKHPITQDLPGFKTTDELWFKPSIHSNAVVLAEAFSQHTANWEPTAFAGPFGEGRCFTLLLGHSADFMQQDGFKKLLISGAEWVAEIK